MTTKSRRPYAQQMKVAKAQPTSLSQRVNAQMTMLTLSQAEVVRRSGMSQPAISMIMNDKLFVLDMINIFKLADALECDPRWLALGVGTAERK